MLSPVRLVLLSLAIAAGSVTYAATRPPAGPRILVSQAIPAARPASKPPAPAPAPSYTIKSILPIDGQGRRLHAALPAAKYVEIDGGPHVMCVTHATEVNRELLAFLGELPDPTDPTDSSDSSDSSEGTTP